MYAIVKTGGKQYRVSEGESLLVERLAGADDGSEVSLEPLLLVDGSDVVDGEGLASVSVTARVVAQERGPKLRVVKFKPKRGYKRRTGHRQELTRIEVTGITRGSGGGGGGYGSGGGGGGGSGGGGGGGSGGGGSRESRAAGAQTTSQEGEDGA
jgi:large subunit ribosomal protein L21